MASSGNFSTFNPLDNATTAGYGNCTLANGNCKGTGASTGHFALASTIATGNTGKYYAEFYLVATDGAAWVGYYSSQQTVTMITNNNKWVPNTGVTWNPANLASYFQDGALYKDGSTASSWGSSYSTTDIIQIAIDADNDAVYYGKNNTWQNSGNPESGASKTGAARTSIPKNVLPAVGMAIGGSSTATWIANFGQDSTFGGTISAGGNADANGFGDFKYAPPSGYVALCTANLPISDDIDPAQTDDNIPTKQFNVATWTGNSTNDRAISLDMAPDLVVIKERGAANNWYWYDSNRGASVGLFSNLNQAEATDTSELKSFTSTGFTLGTGGGTNNNNDTYCGWGWRANGGTTTSFSAGGNQLAGTYQANTKSKFSIITYTGSGSANSEVLHGMSATPNFIIFKARNDTHWWGVYHKSGGTVNTGYDSLLYLNSDNALASGQAVNIVPDSTKIVMSGNEQINRSSSYNYVMYAWADVEGMQKFGTYEGNGNADGPFVYTGFRPRMVFCKSTETNEAWVVADTARSTFNVVDKITKWNNSNTEASGSTFAIDIVSNGFKIRTSWSGWNESGKPLIYGAWADVPFKYNNTF